MIQVNNLGKAYNGKIAVNISELTIHEGEIIGIAGNNGAGKTTFFRLLLDLIKADKGEIFIKDIPVAESENWKPLTAAYLDEGFLINYLTPEEYFYFIGKLSNQSKADVDAFLKNFESFFDGAILNNGKYIRDLSKGNQFKVGIAACLLQNPQLLILDEPFANLDPSTQIRLIQMLQQLHQQHRMTILISSHDLNHINRVCTRILIMEKGAVINDLKTSEESLPILESYFKV
ncbi:MAG: ATP-binding cassette domain-containing protein [Chitinophagaceae bacterium]